MSIFFYLLIKPIEGYLLFPITMDQNLLNNHTVCQGYRDL